jgi:hypothetical protein
VRESAVRLVTVTLPMKSITAVYGMVRLMSWRVNILDEPGKTARNLYKQLPLETLQNFKLKNILKSRGIIFHLNLPLASYPYGTFLQ